MRVRLCVCLCVCVCCVTDVQIVRYASLSHRKLFISCLSRLLSFFATNSSQFFNCFAISCMILLEEQPVSQFQLSIQANFVSLSLVCSSARLIQSKSLRFKFLTDLLEIIFSISLFPISRLNLRLSTKQCLLSPSLSSDGQVNFPFKDLLEVFSVSQRLRKIQFSISFPSRQ